MKPLAAALLLAALIAPAAAREPGCRGTLSGAARGTFPCKLSAFEKDGSHFLVFEPLGPVEGVPGYWPGSFELPGKPEARRYTLDDLVAGRASVGVEGGALYSATKTSSQRGEVTIELTSVKRNQAPGSYRVRGSYRARLVPVGAGKAGEVLVDVTF
jgi:hypothetical protein